MCCFRKYPYPSHGRLFGLNPPSPLWNVQLSPIYVPSKKLAFDTPHPLGIYIDLPWGGYGYFLELHNV